jgi:hypothetical protein
MRSNKEIAQLPRVTCVDDALIPTCADSDSSASRNTVIVGDGLQALPSIEMGHWPFTVVVGKGTLALT